MQQSKNFKNWNFNLESQYGEVWKTIIGYEGIYEISSHGRLKTHNWRATKRTMIVTPKITNEGYLKYQLQKECVITYILAHRLVAIYFISNNIQLEVNHINGIKADNNVANLEWCTRKENMVHASKNNLYKNCPKGEDHKKSILTNEIIKRIKYGDLKNKRVYEIANIIGCSWNAVDRVVKLITWLHI